MSSEPWGGNGSTMRSVSELLQSPADFDLFSESETPDERLLEHGVHAPVLLWARAKDRPVVWGWTLLRRLSALGIGEVATVSVWGDGAEALALALRAEGRAGAYSWDELRRIGAGIRRLGLTRADAQFAELVMGRRGSVLREVERFEALPEVLRTTVRDGMLDLKTAERGAGLPESVLGVFVEGAARLSFSQRRVILGLLYEFCVLGGRPAGEVIGYMRTAFADPDPPAALRALRFPRLSELERRFGEIRDRNLSGSGVELQPPPGFEGSAFQVRFGFETRAQLLKRLEALQKLESRCDELFELL